MVCVATPIHFSDRMIGICVNICGIEHDRARCHVRKFEKEMKKLDNMNISTIRIGGTVDGRP